MTNPQNTTDFNYYLKSKLDETHDLAENYKYILDNIHARAMAQPNSAVSRYILNIYKEKIESTG